MAAKIEIHIYTRFKGEVKTVGFSEEDIQTYVYDRKYHRWVAIQRDSVKEAELMLRLRFNMWTKELSYKRMD